MDSEDQAFRSLYPFTDRWFNRDGLRMHYVDEGAGEPVLCVHGNPTWSFFFRQVIRDLRSAYRVIAPDHVGCGMSDKPSEDDYTYDLAHRVDDLEAFLDHCRLNEPVNLVLHDWGGMIGLTAALRKALPIKRIIVMNTAAFMPEGYRLTWPLRILRDLPGLPALFVLGFNGFAWGATQSAVVKPMAPEVQRAYLAPYDSWSHRIATLRFVQDIPLRDGDPSFALARWTSENLDRLAGVPMQIAWGEQDFVFNDVFLAEWCRRFPLAEVNTFPDAGHYCLEDAGDRIVPLIRAFLDRPVVTANRRAEPATCS